MEELQDAVQIIRVTYDGMEIALKAGGGGLHAMQKAAELLKGMLDYEKTMGQTTMKKLLLRGGDLQVLQFSKEDMGRVKKLAKKYGVLYSVLPEAGRSGGMCEAVFHSEAVPRVNMMLAKLTGAKAGTLEDYLKNGDEEQQEKLFDFLKGQKEGNSPARTEKGNDMAKGTESLLEEAGLYAIGKQEVSADGLREHFQLDEKEAQKLTRQLLDMGVLEQDGRDRYLAVMEKEAFLRRIGDYRGIADRVQAAAAVHNGNLSDILIADSLIAEENDRAVRTRIPGTKGAGARYIWLDKKDIIRSDDGRHMLAFLDETKDYKLYDREGRAAGTMPGNEAYSHYDRVETAVRERYEKALKEAEKKKAAQTVAREAAAGRKR